MNNKPSSLLPSYGRRRGRKLRPSRNALVGKLLPELLIHLEEGEELYTHAKNPVWLEIGFGGGEHLVEQARRHPQVHFIGCEPYINGVASLLAKIQQYSLRNIRLYDGDARVLLERLPDHSLEKLFVLFPDPWPKVRHHKKRIISQASAALFHRKLKKGGILRIATDHADYSVWILENLLAFGQFEWQVKSQADWNVPPTDWVTTRYQEKAMAEGRKPFFLNWTAR